MKSEVLRAKSREFDTNKSDSRTRRAAQRPAPRGLLKWKISGETGVLNGANRCAESSHVTWAAKPNGGL